MGEKSSEQDVLFDNGVFPLLISDFHNQKIIKVNNVFKDWFQRDNPDFSVFTMGIKEELFLSKIHKDGIYRELPLIVFHKNGNPVNCLATARIIETENSGEQILFIVHESLENRIRTADLKKHSANLYALSENIGDMFWSVDSQLKIINFNEKFLHIMKSAFKVEISGGDYILEKIPLSLVEKWTSRYQKALLGDQKKYIDSLFGNISEVTMTPINNEYNEAIGVCCTIRDITEKINSQKKLEIIHKRFNSILNSSADAAIVATDPKGIVRQFNKGASIMLGYGHDEIIGKSKLLTFFAPSFLRELKEKIALETGATVKRDNIFRYLSDHPNLVNKMDWFFLNKSKKSIDIRISISQVLTEGDEFTGILIIAQDISELNRVKEELEQAKTQAEEISQTKTNFLANMSHEIRTPLNGIIGMTDLLKKTELTAVQENYSTIVQKSANSLLLLINDILDFSKIEAGKLDLGVVAFHLRSLIDDLKDMLLINVNKREIDFDIYIDDSVDDNLIGDPRRIKQILLNLVSNALKFTLEGSIKIEIYQIGENGREVTLYFKIIDTGIGISDDEKKNLFQSFSQVDTSTTRKYGGTGLGLAISKELVSMMDGEIGVISEKEEGSTFWFTIKLKSELEIFSRNRILLVNSNKISRNLLSKKINALKMDVKVSESKEEALVLLKHTGADNRCFDLFIIDEHLSDASGSQLLKELKKISPYRDASAVLTSQKEDASKNSFDALLKLPATDHSLKETLHTLLRNINFPESDISIDTQSSQMTNFHETHPLEILVAEDNKINQLVAMHFLKKLGYQADLVEDGKEAVEAFKIKKYDLILMDQMMPLMDGIEASAEIRKIDSQVIIIAVTANAMKGDREFLLNSGMDDYISKPILLKDLQYIMERNLKKRGIV